jgi:hypothetical protein
MLIFLNQLRIKLLKFNLFIEIEVIYNNGYLQ